MIKTCPHCNEQNSKGHGYFFCQSRNSMVKRYYCKSCTKTFSSRTTAYAKYQKKAYLNQIIARAISERNSLRGLARIYKVSYATIYNKFVWLGDLNFSPETDEKCEILYFDEMESSEHTKLKPLTIAIAVDENCKLRGARVGTIPAKGHLSALSRKKYGFRENQSKMVCDSLLKRLSHLKPIYIRSDKKALYPKIIRKHFPQTQIECFKGKRNNGLEDRYQTKKFDPLFPVNHKSGDLRDKINRLARRTWCTTKKLENLQRHLNIRIAYENNCLIC